MDVLLQSLKLGIAPSIVVAIYLLINKILEDKKEAKSAKLSAQVFDSFNKLNNFLDYFTKNIINKEIDKCDLGIRHSFDKLRCTLLDKTVVIVINNNVKLNEKIIKDNLTHLINGEYYVLLKKAEFMRTYDTSLILVPTNESLKDEPGELEISSEQLKEWINTNTVWTEN